MHDELPPADRPPTLRVAPMPADTNAAGDIFGGWIMAQVDIAGSIIARRRARGRVVTVAVNAFHFRKPVFVSDLVSIYAEIVRLGTTSITVDVQVFSERGIFSADHGTEVVKVTEATLTYVAVDAQGRKRPVPPDTD